MFITAKGSLSSINVIMGPLMGATDFRDLVRLGLGSPRSPEEYTTEFFIITLIIHFNYTHLLKYTIFDYSLAY